MCSVGQFMCRENKEKLPIYLYGQSMGAAAVLMASGYRLPSEVKADRRLWFSVYGKTDAGYG